MNKAQYLELGLTKDEISSINKELILPSVKNLMNFAHQRRAELLQEALSWKTGKSQEERLTTILYEVDDYTIGARKPGKEAAPDYNRIRHYNSCPCCNGTKENTNNPNDMLPIILKNGRVWPESQPWTFENMFGSVEQLMREDELGIELLGSLLFRLAFMLDHENENGNWRLNLPEQTITTLEQRIPSIGNVPSRVFIYFLEMLGINEEIKVHTLGYRNLTQIRDTKKGKKTSNVDYGRTNTILTFCHLIGVLLLRKPLSKFAYSFARQPQGMAPLPKTKGHETFPLLSSSLGQVTF